MFEVGVRRRRVGVVVALAVIGVTMVFGVDTASAAKIVKQSKCKPGYHYIGAQTGIERMCDAKAMNGGIGKAVNSNATKAPTKKLTSKQAEHNQMMLKQYRTDLDLLNQKGCDYFIWSTNKKPVPGICNIYIDKEMRKLQKDIATLESAS